MTQIWTAPNPNALGPSNLSNGTAIVVVPVSSSPSGEVQVHFVNEALEAQLKVCIVLTDPSLAGTPFEFQISGGRFLDILTTVIASASPGGACTIVTNYPLGTVVTVTELANGSTQTVTIGPGINVAVLRY